jgi:phosphohistidine phosphatase
VELYLIRHGIAVERLVDTKDEERTLSPIGCQKTSLVAQRLEELGLRFDLILTSPLVRSRQTAEILLSSGLSSQLEESTFLAPDGDIHTWLGWLEKWQQVASSKLVLAIVGHQPSLGEWAEILVWGEARSGLVLKKAGIIGLTLPEAGSVVGRSQMFWLTPPKFLLS